MIIGIGAGGHGRMILSILRALQYDLAGFVDRNASLHGLLVEGVPVLGGHERLAEREYQSASIVLGIGANDERKQLYTAMWQAGHPLVSSIHPSAAVAADVVIGDAPVIMPQAILNQGSHLGHNVIVNTGAIVEHDCVIGDHAHICPGAVLCGGVTVGEGAVIGANATVRDGITIGAWATVGCGAVVVKDVLPAVTVMGNPAHLPYADFYEHHGYCLLPKLCDPVELEAAVQAALRDRQVWLGRQINYVAGQINSVHGLIGEAIRAFHHSVKFVGIATHLLGEQAIPRAVELFAKPAGIGLRSPWHQDNAYWCLEPPSGLTIWVALDHSDQHNGGLSYMPVSYHLGAFPHVASNAPGSSQMIPLDRLPPLHIVTPSLEPGDAAVHHCLTIHGSHQNVSSASRRGVTFQYQGISARVNQDQLKVYEASLEAQIRGRA